MNHEDVCEVCRDEDRTELRWAFAVSLVFSCFASKTVWVVTFVVFSILACWKRRLHFKEWLVAVTVSGSVCDLPRLWPLLVVVIALALKSKNYGAFTMWHHALRCLRAYSLVLSLNMFREQYILPGIVFGALIRHGDDEYWKKFVNDLGPVLHVTDIDVPAFVAVLKKKPLSKNVHGRGWFVDWFWPYLLLALTVPFTYYSLAVAFFGVIGRAVIIAKYGELRQLFVERQASATYSHVAETYTYDTFWARRDLLTHLFYDECRQMQRRQIAVQGLKGTSCYHNDDLNGIILSYC